MLSKIFSLNLTTDLGFLVSYPSDLSFSDIAESDTLKYFPIYHVLYPCLKRSIALSKSHDNFDLLVGNPFCFNTLHIVL